MSLIKYSLFKNKFGEKDKTLMKQCIENKEFKVIVIRSSTATSKEKIIYN